MAIDNIFPLGAGNMFPDNGILSQAYDSRVTQNQIIKVSASILHHGSPYETETALDGSKIYIWDDLFIEQVKQSFNDNKYANFSNTGRKIFEAYMYAILNGSMSSASEEVIALDLYLGGQ